MTAPLPLSQKTGRILLVDDEPAFLRLAGAWLEKLGWSVTTASSATEAREAFVRERPDVAVVDLVMPPERTPEAGLGVLPMFAGVPVIVLTAHADHELALRAVAAGAWDFLAKPVEPELLRFVVSRALAKSALERELTRLRALQTVEDGMIGASPAILRLKEMIRRVGPADLPVMILGPSGSGKELVAQALHAASPRRSGPFVAVHCGAIPGELLESELFGHLKGSFTGAHQDRAGLLATADGGSLFLDEVGETPPSMQVKLLRFLQEGTYAPVGAREPRKADVRVISATHRELDRELPELAAKGVFREDFFYRLKGVILRTPALNERREDIAPLAVHFLETEGAGQRTGKGQDARKETGRRPRISPEGLAWLAAQPWPGNVRELRAVIVCAVALAGADGAGVIGPDELAFARSGEMPQAERETAADSETALGREEPPEERSLPEAVADLERRMISEALAATGNNHSAASRRLGISRVGLLKMMTRLGLR
jgi:DNA-binding NtrC family response regulator